MYTTVSKKKSKLLRTSWNKFWFKIYTGLPATIRALEPIYTKKKKKWSQSTMGLQPIFERLHCYRQQTKFGARQYFHKRVSLCSQGGGGVCIGGSTSGVGVLPLGVCIQRGWSASGGVGSGPPQSDTTGYGQREGGTHPTEMHSCFLMRTVSPASSQSWRWRLV